MHLRIALYDNSCTDLFVRSIQLSGTSYSPFATYDVKASDKATAILAEAVECDTPSPQQVLSCLQSIDVRRLVSGMKTVVNSREHLLTQLPFVQSKRMPSHGLLNNFFAPRTSAPEFSPELNVTKPTLLGTAIDEMALFSECHFALKRRQCARSAPSMSRSNKLSWSQLKSNLNLLLSDDKYNNAPLLRRLVYISKALVETIGGNV